MIINKKIIYKTTKGEFRKGDLNIALIRIKLKDKYVKHIMSFSKDYLFENLLNSYVVRKGHSFMKNPMDTSNPTPYVYNKSLNYYIYYITLEDIKRFIKDNPLKD